MYWSIPGAVVKLPSYMVSRALFLTRRLSYGKGLCCVRYHRFHLGIVLKEGFAVSGGPSALVKVIAIISKVEAQHSITHLTRAKVFIIRPGVKRYKGLPFLTTSPGLPDDTQCWFHDSRGRQLTPIRSVPTTRK